MIKIQQQKSELTLDIANLTQMSKKENLLLEHTEQIVTDFFLTMRDNIYIFFWGGSFIEIYDTNTAQKNLNQLLGRCLNVANLTQISKKETSIVEHMSRLISF